MTAELPFPNKRQKVRFVVPACTTIHSVIERRIQSQHEILTADTTECVTAGGYLSVLDMLTVRTDSFFHFMHSSTLKQVLHGHHFREYLKVHDTPDTLIS